MLPGETLTGGAKAPEPCDCCGGTEFPLQVLSTCAYYVGTACKGCGMPNSRETEYFKKRVDAEKALKDIKRGQMESTRAFSN